MAESNRRDTERVELPADLRGEVMVYQPMTVTEISSGGAQIETPFPLQLGSLHDLRLGLGPTLVVVKGRISHSRVSDVDPGQVVYKSGIEFVEPTEHVSGAISALVAELQARRDG